MAAKKKGPPSTQRKFPSIWHELWYLCDKIRHWLHSMRQPAKAARYTGRLERVLAELPENDLAILRHEGLSLLSELKGKLSEAIGHRKREIELIERLHREALTHGESTRAFMLQRLGESELRQRRRILLSLVRRNDKRGVNKAR